MSAARADRFRGARWRPTLSPPNLGRRAGAGAALARHGDDRAHLLHRYRAAEPGRISGRRGLRRLALRLAHQPAPRRPQAALHPRRRGALRLAGGGGRGAAADWPGPGGGARPLLVIAGFHALAGPRLCRYGRDPFGRRQPGGAAPSLHPAADHQGQSLPRQVPAATADGPSAAAGRALPAFRYRRFVLARIMPASFDCDNEACYRHVATFGEIVLHSRINQEPTL